MVASAFDWEGFSTVATRNDFALATAALKSRFEPESKKELHRTELVSRK